MTNFERIKEMSVEEMVKSMVFCSFIDDCYLDDCEECHRKWLESEVQDENR